MNNEKKERQEARYRKYLEGIIAGTDTGRGIVKKGVDIFASIEKINQQVESIPESEKESFTVININHYALFANEMLLKLLDIQDDGVLSLEDYLISSGEKGGRLDPFTKLLLKEYMMLLFKDAFRLIPREFATECAAKYIDDQEKIAEIEKYLTGSLEKLFEELSISIDTIIEKEEAAHNMCIDDEVPGKEDGN